jgi:hypothetical protein
VALQGVDDRRCLVGIGHRHAREMNPATHGVGQSSPALDAGLVNLTGLGIIRNARDRWACEHSGRTIA